MTEVYWNLYISLGGIQDINLKYISHKILLWLIDKYIIDFEWNHNI